jgi:hypothetical protein
MPRILISGGNFQAPNGVPLAGGYVTFRLNTDAVVEDSQISAGRIVTFPLDANGDLSGYIWPNNLLTPNDTVYIVQAFTKQGELAWHQELYITAGSFA